MSSPTIVVANDNSMYLELIKELLVEEGYPQIWCIGGAAAFDVVCQEQPSLVLLDMNGAHAGEGWHTLDRLRTHPATTHIPVIICATDRRIAKEKKEKVAWLADMPYATLEKPFDLDALLEKIRLILGPPQSR